MKLKFVLAWILVVCAVFGITWNVYTPSTHDIDYSKFMEKVANHNITAVTIYPDHTMEGVTRNGMLYSTTTPATLSYQALTTSQLTEHGVAVRAGGSSYSGGMIIILVIGLIFLIYYLYRNNSNSTSSSSSATRLSMGFSKFNTKPIISTDIKFSDVAGIEEIIVDLQEIVDFLKDPKKYHRLGSKIPKGVLLVGHPGTGKTLLAKALSSEANVPFFAVSGSDFVEMFAGVGASRVRDLFAKAKENAPCIIFIDEIDSIGKKRGISFGGGHDEREQTLNQILVEMDGFESSKRTILILGATNRPDILDNALLRPGRFDRKIFIDMPDLAGREKILVVHTKNIPLDKDIDISIIARGTPGFSGAELANLANEAALIAARSKKTRVSLEDFEQARDKILMGSPKRSLRMTQEEKKLTAYHEAGHALLALFCKYADPIHKITIIPRDMALGLMMQLPERDTVTISKVQLEEKIAIALAGREAERKFFGDEHMTSGASSDIRAATDIAYKMVCHYGMCDTAGMIHYAQRDQHTGELLEYSNEVQKEIDNSVRRFIDNGSKIARGIIDKHAELLIEIANLLLSKETITGDEARLMRDNYLAMRN